MISLIEAGVKPLEKAISTRRCDIGRSGWLRRHGIGGLPAPELRLFKNVQKLFAISV
jgi:hypothetical protein